MASDSSDGGGKDQVIVSRSPQVITFFRFSFACLAVLGFILTISMAYDRIFSLYMTIPFSLRICIAVVAAAVLAWKSNSVFDFFSKLLQRLGRSLPLLPFNTHCVFVAFLIQGICDSTCLDGRKDDNFFLATVSVLSSLMICIVAINWVSDRSGMTDGIAVQFGKMLVVYMMEAKLFQSIICGLVLIYAIVSMFSELADAEHDDSTPLLQNNDSRGLNQVVTRRSVPTSMFIRVFTVLLTLFWFVITIKRVHRVPSDYRSTLLSICIVFVTAGVFAGGYSLYVKLLQWLSECLLARKDKRWFVIFVVTSICGAFEDKDNMLPYALLSALFFITLCVLNINMFSDYIGISDGIIIGLMKSWLVIETIHSKMLQSVATCGLFLLISTPYELDLLTEELNVRNSRRAWDDSSTCATQKD